MSIAVTQDELLQAIRQASSGGTAGEGFTIRELRDFTSIGEERLRRWVRNAISSGAVRVSQKTISDLAGRTQRVPSYVLVQKEATKQKAFRERAIGNVPRRMARTSGA